MLKFLSMPSRIEIKHTCTSSTGLHFKLKCWSLICPGSHKIVRSFLFFSFVTANWTKIPKWDFIFRTCEDGAGWHLIPYRNKSCSEFFSQADKNWHITWGNNLRPDWPPLARGSKFHTITHPPGRFLLSPR